MNKNFLIGSKKAEYYKGILIKADNGLHETICSLVNSCAEKQSKVLDMGAGEGALSQRLYDEGFQIVSADIDESRFKAQGPVFHRIDFNNAQDVNGFYEKHKDYFDIVLGVEVIEHLENPWEYVRLLKKVTKKGGSIIISTPNITSWLSRFLFLFKGEFVSFNSKTADEYGHISPISKWELEYIFKKEGLIEIKTISAGYLPYFWITSNFMITISIILLPFFRVFMRGNVKSWCIVMTGKKV